MSMQFDFQVMQARFLARPNRFLVLAELCETGETVRAHCPDPGRLRELLTPGATVYLSRAATQAGRRTTHDLRFVAHPHPDAQGVLISLDTRVPNRLFGQALESGSLAPFQGYRRVTPEVAVPMEVAGSGTRSRIDYRLDDHAEGDLRCWVEVKSATLVEGGRALFPDAVTARGRRHVLELAHLHQTTGDRVAAVFIVQRPDAQSFAPQEERDPAFAQALRLAHEQGLEVYAYTCRLSLHEMSIDRAIPVCLG